MGNLFGRRKDGREILRKQQKSIRKSVREMDRARMKLQREEMKLIVEIKRMSKGNKPESAKILAGSLIRIRSSEKRFVSTIAQLQSMENRLGSLQSMVEMQNSLKAVVRAMSILDSQYSLPSVHNLLKELGKQTSVMEMQQEMMDEALDEGFDSEEDEAEQNLLVEKVLDEIGIEIGEKLSNAPLKTKKTELTQNIVNIGQVQTQT